MKDTLFIIFQYLVPQHLLSRCIGKLAGCETPWIKNPLIKFFINKYKVNMDEAAIKDLREFKSFNDFFCRKLHTEARPISEEAQYIVSPADGVFSQLGDIKDGRIIQAKGQTFSLNELLGVDNDTNQVFKDGQFATIYLSPKDYHRVHMPLAGTLKQATHIPGRLFSVNLTTCENIPRLYARNERLVTIFETEIGPVAMILVGAMVVASIETAWGGQVSPAGKCITNINYQEKIHLNKGDEMGRFKLGSTVILLFPKDTITWDNNFQAESNVRMGERIAENKKSRS